MTTFDNRPATETPDYIPCAGNRCANCELRCPQCKHLAAAEPTLAMPMTWDGDQA